MKFLYLIILFVGLLCSCQPNPYEHEINQIDSLLTIISGTEQIYATIDTSLLKKIQLHVKTKIAYLESRFDTLPYDIAMYLSEYSYPLKKQYKAVLKNYGRWKEEIEYTKKQLNNLRHDLEKKLIEKSQAHQYLLQEQSYVLKLNQEIAELGNAAMTFAQNFHKKDSLLTLKIDSALNNTAATNLTER